MVVCGIGIEHVRAHEHIANPAPIHHFIRVLVRLDGNAVGKKLLGLFPVGRAVGRIWIQRRAAIQHSAVPNVAFRLIVLHESSFNGILAQKEIAFR